ncbi:hypothetical protein E4Q23_22695 [Candidatus Accumulibacter phosphatis]|uniref:Transposase IS801/IS1294 domain-containing protein n=1 Tax=Candidatus Accumulibacter phosphatis TaxID=327160 RepID=A0ABX1U1B3_9PROT|nr:hypothetical protein [Candidatus Accumulibacter phosphatis]
MVHAKQPLGDPEAVLDYLGRYTHRVAMSNERIVGIEGNDVLFRVRVCRLRLGSSILRQLCCLSMSS